MKQITCSSCHVQHERPIDSTWHNNQCDDCIVRWAYEKAVQDADKSITDSAHESLIRFHVSRAAQWRESMRKRGLLP